MDLRVADHVALLIACETVEGGRMPDTPVPRPAAPVTPMVSPATTPGMPYPDP